MCTQYGMPFLFHDNSRGSFKEFHNRMNLNLRNVQRESPYPTYIISDHPSYYLPRITLIFGPNDALGSIQIGDSGIHVPMDQYLSVVPSQGSSGVRQFMGSDGQTYTWSWRSVAGDEWTCLNSRGYPVASYGYSPLLADGSSARLETAVFQVEEEYPHLVLELLASLTIIRYIVSHDL